MVFDNTRLGPSFLQICLFWVFLSKRFLEFVINLNISNYWIIMTRSRIPLNLLLTIMILINPRTVRFRAELMCEVVGILDFRLLREIFLLFVLDEIYLTFLGVSNKRNICERRPRSIRFFLLAALEFFLFQFLRFFIFESFLGNIVILVYRAYF